MPIVLGEGEGYEPFPRPDWKDATAYPKKLTPREWAWEFLRRSPEYKLDWYEFQRRGPGYGLKRMIDPAITHAPEFTFRPGARCYVGPTDPIVLAPNEAAIVIDLTWPIEEQLAEAARKLPRPKIAEKRLRENEYPSYLRILDALSAGATHAEIARVIRYLCQAANCEWYYDRLKNVIAIWPRGGHREGEPPIISPETGMIGYPEFSVLKCTARTLFNPELTVGKQFKVKSQLDAANGTWTAVEVGHNLASKMPHGPWETHAVGVRGP